MRIPMASSKPAHAATAPPSPQAKASPVPQVRGCDVVPAGEAASDANEIDCPITGEIVDLDSVDDMIDCFERVQAMSDKCYAVTQKLRESLAAKTEGDAVTRRVAGRRRKAKVTMPDESFEQSVLKELWNSHPVLAQQHMKIASISVQMREFKKLVNTSSDQPDFIFFRDALTKAHRGRIGTPRVTVEQ